MPLSTQAEIEEEQYILVASLDNVRNLSNILKAIHFRDHASCFVTANGLKVTVENAKCLQANAFIQAGIFQEFVVQEESVMFRINLSVLLDCLTIFGASSLPGTHTAFRMCYRGYGYPLTLFLEEGGVVTVCKINTQEPEDILDFDFCSTNVVNKIILQSDGLREAFSELDMTSEVLQITMSPEKPYFRLSTFGNAGSAHLDYPKDSDLIEAFHCNQTQTNRYKISLLKPSIKALALSCKVSIRTDNRGFLSLQYMIRNEDGQICFAEYYCCPDEDITEAEVPWIYVEPDVAQPRPFRDEESCAALTAREAAHRSDILRSLEGQGNPPWPSKDLKITLLVLALRRVSKHSGFITHSFWYVWGFQK